MRIGVLGATSSVGDYLLPLLTKRPGHIVAFSRRAAVCASVGVEWRHLDNGAAACNASQRPQDALEQWICLAPVWVLNNYLDLLEMYGVQRIVALSSTSRFTKIRSSSLEEQALARQLAEGEDRIIEWAEARGVEWTILRPTLVYGGGRDKNVAEIARFIRRFGFFPLLGAASGLRQPVHAEDVATACAAALKPRGNGGRAYDLSGGEALTYREMVSRVFVALGQRPKFVTMPLPVFRLLGNCLRLFPHYRHWTAAMAERMNQNLVFDHSAAARELNFLPRAFRLEREDVAL